MCFKENNGGNGPIQSRMSHENLIPHFRICVTNVYQEVICDECSPWHSMCLGLFLATSFHNIQKKYKKKKKNLGNQIDSEIEGICEKF